MKESEIEEYANKLKQSTKGIGDLAQEIKLEILKGRVKYELNTSLIHLLENTLNKESVKKIIENKSEYGYDNLGLLTLVVRLTNYKFLKENLHVISNGDRDEDAEQSALLKILKERVEKELKSGSIYVLENTLNKESIKKIIENKSEYGYDNSKLLEIVVRQQDINFLNENLQVLSSGNRENDIEELTKMLIKSGSHKFLREIINNREQYKFSSKQMVELILDSRFYTLITDAVENPNKYGIDENDSIVIDDYLEFGLEQTIYNNWKRIALPYNEKLKINLPSQMTIGVEIESKGEEADQILGLFDRLPAEFDNWEIEEDGSLEEEIDAYSTKIEGIEFISPVLRTGENAENEIYQVCALLDSCGEYCDVETGGHIHIGADYLTNINAYKNLIEMWTNSEKILYIISNKEGEVPREVGEYAPPFSKKMKEAVEDGLEEENLEQFIEKIKEIQGERYSSINFLNIGDENKNTIEFRLSNGTIDPKTWIENINLFGGLIVAAQELSVIQERVSRGEEVTEQQKEKLSAFEKITTLEDTKENEEDKLKALLDLCINKNEQDIYLNRYAVNKELIKDREIVENVGVIRINRKQIGKLAFTGQEQINGVEYQQAKQIIEDDLLRDVKENNSHTISE